MKREKLKDLYGERRTFTARTVIAALACVVLVSALVFRLFALQVLQQNYYATRAEENRTRLSAVPPVRGLIYDRNGVVLAQNSPAYVLEVVPEQVKDITGTLQRLSALVRLDEKDVARFRDRIRKTPRYRGTALRTNLSIEEVARFELNRYDFKGVDVTAGLSRNYPLSISASHLVGYVSSINEDELKRLNPAEYEGLTLIGKIGAEKSHEDDLRGLPGAEIVEANAYGRPLRELEYRASTPGRDLVLTIDSRVQLVAERALGVYDGAVVAIDPRSGDIVAMVSKPGFDPHLFVDGIDTKTYKALLEDPKRPLYNRALQGTYPPGSTIKPFMALAGLENDVIDASHREYCSGAMGLPNSSRKYRCWKRQGHGSLDMMGGIMRSCDIYFYQLAMTLGIDRIHDFLGDFGLGAPTQVDLPLEKGALLPSREWKRRVRREAWYPGETLNIGIGQGYLTVTPMQLAQATARMSMRGGGFKPHIVRAEQDPITGEQFPVAPEALPPIPHRHPEDWEHVVEAMHGVTQTQGGTGYAIFKDAPYTVAGKTGTAQVAGLSQDDKAPTLESTSFHLRDHALFIAFAPADDPRIAIAVIAEHGGHGGSVAGPVARQVMDQYLLGDVIHPAEAKPEDSAIEGDDATQDVDPAPAPGDAVAPETER